MKAYWVANYTEIKDTERLKKYAVKAKEAVEKFSGKILARSADIKQLNVEEILNAEINNIEYLNYNEALNLYNNIK